MTDAGQVAPERRFADLLAWQASPSEPPRAIIQIAHGMGEHAARYDRLARAFMSAGHVVYANRHRGHGPAAAASGTWGDFGPGGFAAVVADMAHVRCVRSPVNEINRDEVTADLLAWVEYVLSKPRVK